MTTSEASRRVTTEGRKRPSFVVEQIEGVVIFNSNCTLIANPRLSVNGRTYYWTLSHEEKSIVSDDAEWFYDGVKPYGFDKV
jgi:hypothetical protein